MKILLVDDQPVALDRLLKFLSVRDHEVTAAANGREALMKMEQQTFDLVITDAGMPVMGGIELLEEISRKSPRPAVILMTGDRDLDVAVAAFRGGATDYLKKPVDVTELLARIALIEERP